MQGFLLAGATAAVIALAVAFSSGGGGNMLALATATTSPPLPAIKTIGWVGRISSGDGVIQGWAVDQNNGSAEIMVNVYVDATSTSKGTLIGSTTAAAYYAPLSWADKADGTINNVKVPGNHGFIFNIPRTYFDGKPHIYSVEPVDTYGRIGRILGMTQSSVTIPKSANTPISNFTTTACINPSTKCISNGNDYLTPNFPASSGWSDGVNYFNKWGCTATNDINYIARLQIIPRASHSATYQKDSLAVNFVDTYNTAGNPWLFFTSSSYDHGSVFSLKKTLYDATAKQWKVYSVLDNPYDHGGVSSQDGRGTSFIMNDYSLPGWGPSSPIPGSTSKVPGVSNTSASRLFPSYPLVGTGPLGITAIMNTPYPSTVSGGVEGRTCIHMNPKLFDYDATGHPQSLMVNMWQNTTKEPCQLPPGAPTAKLPTVGNYIYRYKGTTLGWQLDLTTGQVTDSVTNDTTNRLELVYKLIPGTPRSFISATWDGIILSMDLNKPKASNAKKILDCAASGAHFGEATGKENSIYFLADPPGEPLFISTSPNVFTADIFYAFHNGPPAATTTATSTTATTTIPNTSATTTSPSSPRTSTGIPLQRN